MATTDSQDAESATNRTEGFITSRKLLLDCADAVQRIMEAYKDVTELAGYTSRVAEVLKVFEDITAGRTERQLCDGADVQLMSRRGNTTVLLKLLLCVVCGVLGD